jgi:peptidylprolyl isomerase
MQEPVEGLLAVRCSLLYIRGLQTVPSTTVQPKESIYYPPKTKSSNPTKDENNMALQKGDFILIDYTARIKETNEVFDTTSEQAAKDAHLHKEGAIYEPELIVIGENWKLKPLDEAFPTMEPGKPATVEIPPDKAFGPRDPQKIRRISLKQLLAQDIHNPTIGMRITYQGKTATIRSIGAGRVLLDFNPPLAGRTLIYEVTVQKKLETNIEKTLALIHRRIPVADPTKFQLTTDANALTIELPEETFYLEGVQVAKRGIAFDIQKFFPETTIIRFVETYKTEPKPSETKPATA